MPPARDLTEVAPGVLVATSRRWRTTSTLVLGAGETLVVDPAWEEHDRRYLEAVLSGRDPDDPRVSDPGNAELHRTNLARAKASR